MKILSVIGARPQFVKAAVVSRALRRRPGIEEVLVHTGQHYDANMSDVFFEEMEIPRPDLQLGVGSAAHGAQTGRMLEALEQVMLERQPDWVLVYGDTNSTIAGSLAAAKLHIPVAHVEAGLRSYNRRMPEEVNRVLTDHVSDLLLVPSGAAADNLRREGIDAAKVFCVGDVMCDATLHYLPKAKRESRVLERHGLKSGDYILSTVHRAENTDDRERLVSVFDALVACAEEREVVLPLHPRTHKALQAAGLFDRYDRALTLIEPVGYLDMIALLHSAALVATDSGGVQKEAYFCGVPCVTMREETEWTELVEAGWNIVVGEVTSNRIIESVRQAMAQQPRGGEGIYGRGDAAEQIVDLLLEQRVSSDGNAPSIASANG